MMLQHLNFNLNADGDDYAKCRLSHDIAHMLILSLFSGVMVVFVSVKRSSCIVTWNGLSQRRPEIRNNDNGNCTNR